MCLTEKPAIHHAIVREIYTALEKLDAPPKLLGIIGSWGDTLDDDMVLDMLKTWNETGDIKLDPPPRLSWASRSRLRLWTITDPITKRRRETRYQRTEAQARERFGDDAVKVEGSLEIRERTSQSTSDFLLRRASSRAGTPLAIRRDDGDGQGVVRANDR